MNKRKSVQNRARLPSFNEEEEQTTATMEQPAEPKVDEAGEEEDDGEKENQQDEIPKETEKKEEAKLKAKYPGLKAKGGSSFLAQKKLQRGHKFFDSGDYNLVKGKKPGLSGATSSASKTKPEKAKEVEVEAPVDIPEFATADAIISRRMALFRTKSESYADVELKFPGGRNMRSGSLFVSTSTPQMSPSGGIRRGSMFPIGQSTGSDIIPSAELLKNRRQSMIPAIPSKLAQ